jgi:hypothetical protein
MGGIEDQWIILQPKVAEPIEVGTYNVPPRATRLRQSRRWLTCTLARTRGGRENPAALSLARVQLGVVWVVHPDSPTKQFQPEVGRGPNQCLPRCFAAESPRKRADFQSSRVSQGPGHCQGLPPHML